MIGEPRPSLANHLQLWEKDDMVAVKEGEVQQLRRQQTQDNWEFRLQLAQKEDSIEARERQLQELNQLPEALKLNNERS